MAATTFTQQIIDLAADVDANVARLDPKTRCHELAAASLAAASLEHAVAAARGRAVRALVDEVGATVAARELGVSRNRVYVLMKQGDEE